MIPVIHTGHRLRIAREEAGVEIREMSERTGIATSTIVRYEKGRTRPKKLALRAYSDVTGVPVYWLEHGMTEAPAPTPIGAAAGASGAELPRLDSNQQPADYRPIASLEDKRRRVAQRQRAPRGARPSSAAA